jgi:signal transduction histidine kinase/DNA-binding LacI/PurR family transcriptional regulator
MTPREARSAARAPTIGVLVDLLEGEYQSGVVGGMVEASLDLGFNMILLYDNLRRARGEGARRSDMTYDLAGAATIDGIVVMAGPLANIVGMDELAAYCERFRPRPMCSIAATVRGMTGVLVDGEPALREGIRHLVEEHGCRDVAFLAGPPQNVEARARLQVYRETLAELGLPAPDANVAAGGFRYEAGVNGVEVLFDQRGLRPDAIVASSDTMALGAIDALRVRGLHVPSDVAVTGFDDISDARYSLPSLTTIRQPLRQQGRLATEVLLRRLRGENVEDPLVLPAELIVRRSCGCYPETRHIPGALERQQRPVSVAGEGAPRKALVEARPGIVEAVREAAGELPADFPEDWAEGLVDSLLTELSGGPAGFGDKVRQLLKETMQPAATGHPLRPALAALGRELLPALSPDEVQRAGVGERLDEAEYLVGEAIEESHMHYRLMIERRRRSLTEATEALSGAYDLESLGEALHESLPQLGVPSAFLVLDRAAAPGPARVVFAHDPRRDPAELERLMCTPVDGACLPDGLLPKDRRYTMVAEPLFFEDESLGYAIFEMTPRDAFTYDAFGALRVRVSGAVKVALLIEELQLRVGQLRQAQKMETLGQLSGAIAHDFNNLLQAIRGYAELAAMAEPGSAEAKADLEEIVRASDRAAELTRQLLTFSQPTRANARVVDVNACVQQALPLIKSLMGPTIEVSTVLRPGAGRIVIDPAQFEQALVNLCVNGRDAMREGGSVTIETGSRADTPRLARALVSVGPTENARRLETVPVSYVSVFDTGAGIAPEIKDRIFEPFFTTKDTGQGTGLGLSIVYGIVHGAGGEIAVETKPGKGTGVWLVYPASPDREESVAAVAETPIRGSETVLLVEDEAAIRKLAQRVLVDAGYRVLTAANGEEARGLWQANEGRVELLLSDVTLPGMSGVAFAAELASGPKPPRTLFISGHLAGPGGGPDLPAGAAFLPKPFSVSALLDAVRGALDSPKPR